MNQGSDRSWIFVVLASLGALVLPGLKAAGSRAPAPFPPIAAGAAPAEMAEGDQSATLGRVHELLRVTTGVETRGPRPVSSVKALVVTVPDPASSHLAWYFDQGVGAVISAASRAGLTLQRSWMPWSPPGRKEEGSDGRCCPAEAAAKPDPALVPGLLLFHGLDAQTRRDETLIVFLVGESPLSGVHGAALREALNAAVALTPSYAPLSVLGPFFSGSASSLLQGLGAFSSRHRQVVTGSATAGSLSALFRNAGVEFERTVATDDELRCFVYGQLAARDPKGAPRIAVLTENTTYGEGFTRHPSPPLPTRQAVASGSGACGVVAPTFFPRPTPTAFVNRCDVLPQAIYRYPLHLAQLRMAHAGRAPAKSQEVAATLRHSLELRLDGDGAGPSDMPPVFSSLTAFDDELALRRTLVAISRAGFRYLVLVATDTTDLLYLAREARTYCPGVQLVTFGSDLILNHPDLLGELTGLLAGSSYPLVPDLQSWTSRDITRQVFASQSAEGMHNAALALYRKMPVGLASPPPDLLDYGRPGCVSEGPQMWLSVLTAGRSWPLVSRPSTAEEGSRPDRPGAQSVPRPLVRSSGLADGVALLWGALCAAQILVLLLARRERFRTAPVVGLFVASRAKYARRRSIYLGVHLVALVVFAALLFVPAAWVAAATPSAPRGWVVAAGTLSAAACGLWALAVWGRALFGCLAEIAQGRRLRYDHAIFVGATGLLGWMTCATARYVGALLTLPEEERLLFVLRAVEPFGMCPLSPLFYLVLGFQAWALLGLARLRAVDDFPSSSPLLAGGFSIGLRASDLARTLDRTGHRRLRFFELAIVGLFVVPGYYFWRHVMPTFEARGYDSLAKCAFLVLYGLIILSFAHFIISSRVLHGVLLRLASEPMADAYDRIGEKIHGSFGASLRGRVPDPGELAVSIRSCEALAAMAPKVAKADPILGPVIASARAPLARLARLLQATLEDPSSRGTSRRGLRVHGLFFLAAIVLSRRLRRLWQVRAMNADPSGLAKDQVATLLPEGTRAQLPTAALMAAAVAPEAFLWIRMAEDFVAMRIATFINHVLRQIRWLITFALAAAIALVCFVLAYPFHPRRFMTIFSWSLVLVVVAGVLLVILRLERNEIMSRLTRSEPGRINFRLDFVGQVALYVVVPLTVVLSGLFPEVGDVLFSWVEPLTRILS